MPISSRLSRTRQKRNASLAEFHRAEMMNTRGFKDGKKAWIDVMPMGGRKMRVTHEFLDGLSGTPEDHLQTLALLFKVHEKAKEALPVDCESAMTLMHNAGAIGAHLNELTGNVSKNTWDNAKNAHSAVMLEIRQLAAMRCQNKKKGATSRMNGLSALERFHGFGSSFALFWAAAGATALVVLSNAQNAAKAQPESPRDPARELILKDLNRARVTQGLAPLPS